MRLRQLVVLVALAVAGGGACGPIVSGVEIVNANVALSAAETAGAKEHAPYDYHAAREYLDKAREEHGYSDFWAARQFAAKALEYAQRARQTAESASSAGQSVVLPPSAPPTQTEPTRAP